MSEKERLVLPAPWVRGHWEVGFRGLLMFLLMLFLMAVATDGFKIRPGRPVWQEAITLGVLVLLGLGMIWSDCHRPGGWEFELREDRLHIRELLGVLYTRRLRVLREQEVSAEDLCYLESQHGVILKAPSFHRDLILPKEQAQELISWLQEQGVQRFSLAEASR